MSGDVFGVAEPACGGVGAFENRPDKRAENRRQQSENQPPRRGGPVDGDHECGGQSGDRDSKSRPGEDGPAMAGAPIRASRVRHHPAVDTKTTALTTPARKRNSGQKAGSGRAMPSVSSTVAIRPERIITDPDQDRGSTMHSSAPAR